MLENSPLSSRENAPGIAAGSTYGVSRARDGSGRPPLIAHVIDRLKTGGMENGLVNLINGTPKDRYRHAVICLRGHSDFRDRIQRDDVEVFSLDKRAGKDIRIYAALWRLLRRLRPDIVHTRNLPAIDMVVPAALAGGNRRVHGEHGRDVLEMHGGNRKYNLLRRALAPLVHRYISVSRDLETWLCRRVGIPQRKVVQIYNGVDSTLFHPAGAGREPLPVAEFAPAGTTVIGTVGRMETVKDQVTLARAFIHLLSLVPEARSRLRLVLVGDGSLRAQAADILKDGGAADLCWLPGDRPDVAALLRGLDIFVLPSINEGISNTILEAMASGLPVVATDVGGNPELVVDGETGALVPPGDPARLAETLRAYVENPDLARRHGRAGRERVEATFSLDAMVARYLEIYDDVLADGMRR